MLDLIDTNVFWSILLIVHGLISVALLGALTHQTFALRKGQSTGQVNFYNRFSSVNPAVYTYAICLLWILSFVFGGWIYSKYRINIRIPLEQMGFMKTQGFFEMKEHLVSFGIFLLPAYFSIWKLQGHDFDVPKKYLTYMLCFIAWFSFLVGHVVNNVRGFGQ